MRFPEPNLEDTCEIIMGQAPAGDAYNNDDSGWPLVAGAGDFGVRTPAVKKYTSQGTKFSIKGDIILGIRASIGAKVWSDREYCLGRGVAGLRPKIGLSPEYLWHWLDQVRPELTSKGRGATFLQVNRKDIRELKIPLPPLAEQKRIAAILDAADELRTKRRESLAQLDTLLQSTFLEMFGDPVTNRKGWDEVALENICERVVDCPHSTPNWANEGVICLRTSNLGKGEWIWDDTRYVTEDEYFTRSKRCEVDPGDIILSREGTVGIAAIVQPGMRVCMGQRLVQLRPIPTAVHSEYLLRLLLHDLAPDQISKLMVGSTSKHLNVRDLRCLKLGVPPLKLQIKFAEVAEEVRRAASRGASQLTELDTLFASLQSRAFRGEL